MWHLRAVFCGFAIAGLLGCGSGISKPSDRDADDQMDTASAGGAGGAGGGQAGGSGGGQSGGAGGGSAPPDAIPLAASCDPARPGAGGKVDNQKAGSILFNVRVPSTYKPTAPVPALFFFAPAGADRVLSEGFTGLTIPANNKGFIIVYVDHVSPSQPAGNALQGLVKQVTETWCVDPRRIYLSGHSDGASVVAAFMVQSIPGPPRAAGVGLSATGWSTSASTPCPVQNPIHAMIMHSTDDKLFPGLGPKLRDFYVRCMKCTAAAPVKTCSAYTCENGGSVQFCEGNLPHGNWPTGINGPLMDFFNSRSLP